MPLIDLAAHDHWVWKVQHNPFHDNLLLSCSSDNTCSLWHLNLAAATCALVHSSSPAHAKAAPGAAGVAAGGQQGADGGAAAGGQKPGVVAAAAAAAVPVAVRAGPGGKPPSRSLPPTGRLQHYTGHQDSVYQAAWAATDPWAYVSLSFDGRLVLHSVPASIKYKLLL